MSTPDEGRREPEGRLPGSPVTDTHPWERRTGAEPRTLPALPEREPVRPVEAVGGVGHVDPWNEPEPARRDLYDQTAWIERMIWRNVLLIIFVIGLVSFALDWLPWMGSVALAVGGLVPGLVLMIREQYERNIEAERRESRPETRHDGTLPPLRRTINRPLELDGPDD